VSHKISIKRGHYEKNKEKEKFNRDCLPDGRQERELIHADP